MATIRYLCRGLIGLVVLVAVFLAKATSSHGRMDIISSSTANIPSMNHPKAEKQLITAASKFDLLSNLQKGDTHSGLMELKKFLGTLGYLPPHTPPTPLFDDHLEAAVRLYQRSFNLSVTGILDRATLDVLRVPRCGREDVRDGWPLMLLPKPKARLWSHKYGSRLATQLEAQKWELLGSKWKTTRNLTYAFSNFAKSPIVTSDDIRSAVASAFASWGAVVPIYFQETHDFEGANIKIEFVEGDHADGFPFDGRLGVLSHAFGPEDGRFHLDDAELWTVSMAITNDTSAVDLETVALHEIGHLIGLHHSNVNGSVMFPGLEARKVKRKLTNDDINGATALYGPRTWQEYVIAHHVPSDGDLKKRARYRITFAFLALYFVVAFLGVFFAVMICWKLGFIPTRSMHRRNAARSL